MMGRVAGLTRERANRSRSPLSGSSAIQFRTQILPRSTRPAEMPDDPSRENKRLAGCNIQRKPLAHQLIQHLNNALIRHILTPSAFIKPHPVMFECLRSQCCAHQLREAIQQRRPDAPREIVFCGTLQPQAMIGKTIEPTIPSLGSVRVPSRSKKTTPVNLDSSIAPHNRPRQDARLPRVPTESPPDSASH